jgi:hypothetical protein
MNIQFFNYDIISKRINSPYKYNNDFTNNPTNGAILIDEKILLTLNINQQELKNILIHEKEITYIYNKDFEQIINYIKIQINKQPVNNKLYELKMFFELSQKIKSKYITLQNENTIL